ncbi:hypothetical protein CC80DRAFT_441047, partial [Byssothecium circinans]
MEADPQLKRLQQDLLILTSMNDNSTLSWRPTWFSAPALDSAFWTLQNPPDVVTEPLPLGPAPLGSQIVVRQQVMTRRMRQDGDRAPAYITTVEKWERYCAVYGVPWDFLCEDQVRLMRLGLARDASGSVCAPPTWPLHPEPQHPSQGEYILAGETHSSLPLKFH